MNRRDKAFILVGVTAFIATILLLVVMRFNEKNNGLAWVFDDKAETSRIHERSASPPLLNLKGHRVVSVGRTVFIDAKGVDQDSAILLNNKVLDRDKYTIATNEGIYLQAPSEGVFLLRAVSLAGESNVVTFEVSNSYNIHLLYPSEFISRYSSIEMISENKILKLNNDGQAIDSQKFLASTGDYAVVQVVGVSRKTGSRSTIGWAIKNADQKISGLVVDANTTAEYLINKKLADLNQFGLNKRMTNTEVLAVSEVASIIKNQTYEANDINLDSSDLQQQLVRAVRLIRRSRE